MKKAKKNRDAMTDVRWTRIKSIGLPAPRMLHQSCAASMQTITDPKDGTIKVFPWVQRHGETYNVGRNAAKRARRAA